MAIPGPGTAISINTIVGEFGGTTPHSISEYYRGGGLVPNTPGNSAIPTSGAIALGNFYGSANRNSYTLTISADTQNYDVYTNRGPAYIAGSTDITVQINPGVTVGSSSVPAYAMLVPSAFSPGDTITIVNNGSIRGAGGGGGGGGSAYPAPFNVQTPGSPGSAGGNGLYVNRPTTVTNNGTVAGGGGGGGGGGGAIVYRPTPKAPQVDNFHGGGGGGGGAGNNVGGGGAPGPAPSPGGAGSAGTATTGGGGGSGASSIYGSGGPGGAGGGAGAAGAAGSPNSAPFGSPTSGGSAGGAGNYITGNSFVTWPATGTRQGGVA